MPVFGKRSLQSLEGVHPNMVKLMKEAIKDSPIDFTITDGVRTTKEQQALYAKGRTAAGSIVTTRDGVIRKSEHQAKSDGFGYAVDLYAYKNGKIDFNDTKSLEIIAAHIKATAKCMGINIIWGGDFKATKTLPKGWDKPHFELV